MMSVRDKMMSVRTANSAVSTVLSELMTTAAASSQGISGRLETVHWFSTYLAGPAEPV